MAKTSRTTRKTTAKKKPAARKAAAAGDNAARLRAALLHLIATQGWRDLSLAAVGDRLCLAYHCVEGPGFLQQQARIVTVFREAK